MDTERKRQGEGVSICLVAGRATQCNEVKPTQQIKALVRHEEIWGRW